LPLRAVPHRRLHFLGEPPELRRRSLPSRRPSPATGTLDLHGELPLSFNLARPILSEPVPI
jgi:hypothetical protein